MTKNINFSSKFKKANICSLLFFLASVLFILFKGLNYGIDFKGGTLIELRVDNQNIDISDVRSSLKIIPQPNCRAALSSSSLIITLDPELTVLTNQIESCQ